MPTKARPGRSSARTVSAPAASTRGAALDTWVLAGVATPVGVTSVGFGPVEVSDNTMQVSKTVNVVNKGDSVGVVQPSPTR